MGLAVKMKSVDKTKGGALLTGYWNCLKTPSQDIVEQIVDQMPSCTEIMLAKVLIRASVGRYRGVFHRMCCSIIGLKQTLCMSRESVIGSASSFTWIQGFKNL